MLQTLSCSCDDTRSWARTVHKHKTHTHTHTRTHVTLTHIDTSMSYVRGAKHTCLNTHTYTHTQAHTPHTHTHTHTTHTTHTHTRTHTGDRSLAPMQTSSYSNKHQPRGWSCGVVMATAWPHTTPTFTLR